MYIIGAGLAGLLAANNLRKYKPKILERQPDLPNNHNAVLRHRDSEISVATCIPFKEVRVMKAINYEGKTYTEITPKLANLYSRKVTGKILSRSITNLDTATRYIAPLNFVERLSWGCSITYNQNIQVEDLIDLGKKHPVISTMPMPLMWAMLNDEPIDFDYQAISTVVCYINAPITEVYQTVYYPNPDLGLYRLSITGNKVMAEFIGNAEDYSNPHPRHGVIGLREYVEHFLEIDFGIENPDLTDLEIHNTKYGKIVPIDDSRRKEFIHMLSVKYNIYSLGRYATWRNLLLDDVHRDISKIERMMKERGFNTNWR